jgi:hypothetical protein
MNILSGNYIGPTEVLKVELIIFIVTFILFTRLSDAIPSIKNICDIIKRMNSLSNLLKLDISVK